MSWPLGIVLPARKVSVYKVIIEEKMEEMRRKRGSAKLEFRRRERRLGSNFSLSWGSRSEKADYCEASSSLDT